MEIEYNNLNALENKLPDILPGTENEFIKVNSNATDYELADPTSGLVPAPQSSKLLLNSYAVGGYDWTDQAQIPKITLDGSVSNGLHFQNGNKIYTNINDLRFENGGVDKLTLDTTGVKVDTIRAGSGSQVDDKGYVFEDSHGSGLQWETSGGILRLCHTNSTLIGMSSTAISFNSSNINANGTLTCSGKINAGLGSSLGIGISGQSTGVDFNLTNSTTNIRANGISRVSCSTTGTNVTGNLTQTASSGNVNTSSGQTTHTGLFRIDKGTLANALEIISGNIISTSNDTNITSTSGTCSMGIIKANNAGTSVLNSVRVVDDNTGLFQGTSGRLDLCASGTSGLNLTTNRIQNQITFECARSLAFSSVIYNISQVYNIVTSTSPFIIVKTASSGTIDLEFTTPGNYFGNQEFKLLVLNTGAGTARYRAQAETIHITGGAAAATITSNTYHTLTKDRFHFVYCNIDGSRFYLIQT
jgi:hypothetical protein